MLHLVLFKYIYIYILYTRYSDIYNLIIVGFWGFGTDEKVNERGFLGFDSIEMDNGNSRIFHDNLHSQTIDELNVKVPNSEDNAHSLKAIGHSTLEFSSKKLTPRQRWRKAIRKVIIRNKERKVENKLFGRKILNLGDDPLSTRCVLYIYYIYYILLDHITIINV